MYDVAMLYGVVLLRDWLGRARDGGVGGRHLEQGDGRGGCFVHFWGISWQTSDFDSTID